MFPTPFRAGGFTLLAILLAAAAPAATLVQSDNVTTVDHRPSAKALRVTKTTVAGTATSPSLRFSLASNLPAGTYTFSFRFRWIDKPDDLRSTLRGSNGDGSDFEKGVSIAGASGFWYRHQVTLTVAGTDVWTGNPEIMVKLWNNDTDAFELLVDDVSLVNSTNQQMLTQLFSFEADTVGSAPAGVSMYNGTFDSMTVVALTSNDYTATWIGNNWGGAGSYFIPRVNHVQMKVDSMAVGDDGTVYTNSDWDESHKLLGTYRDGLDLGQLLQATNQYTWLHPDGGAVATNATHAFISVLNGSFRRYLRSTRIPAGADVSVCTQTLTGLAASATEVFVSDPQNQKIKVYDAGTLGYLREFSVTAPTRLALDSTGGLWVLQHGVTTDVRRYATATGLPTGEIITFPATTYPTALAWNAVANRLLVADAGGESRIRIYNPTWIRGPPTAMSATFGNLNGLYGGTRGAYAPLKFTNLSGVGVDTTGNIYVATSALGETGVAIESYTAAGTPRWDLKNLCFVTTADLDPGAENDFYTLMHRMRVDYTKGYDAFWTPGGYTFDPVRFPNDPRNHLDVNYSGVIAVRRIQGQKFVFATNMYADWLAVYRFDSTAQGEIAIPCGLWAKKNLGVWPATQPASGEWIWSDADGDGTPEAGEYSSPGTANAPGDTWGWTITASGDVWQCSKTGGIRRFLCTGLVNGAPRYSYLGTDLTTYAMPAPFTQLRRVEYDAAKDAVYLTGYTAAYPNDGFIDAGTQEIWGKCAGRVLARYSGWLAGNRTTTWTVNDLVFRPSHVEHMDVFIAGMAIAGDYVFLQWSKFDAVLNDHKTDVYRASDGQFVKTFQPGPTASLDDAQIDMPYGMRAAQRANGEYVVTVEDDWFGKVLVYRWTPEVIIDNTSTTEAAPTGAWTASTVPTGYYGTNYVHDGNIGKGSSSVRFTPYLNPGTYQVYLRWTADPNRASNAPVTIVHATGTATTTVDQRSGGGAWNSVGSFRFDVGTAGYVTIGNAGTTGYVVADAVRFVRTGD